MKKKIYIGASYYPEHWPRERWAEDIRLMKEAGIHALRMAELAWSFLEPEDGRFDFEWLDQFIDMAYKEGIEVILGTPTEASPVWLRNKHPDVVATDEFGNIHGGRGRHCYNNPVFIQYVERLVTEMAKHYANNPAVIGWQIDNELRGTKCYCKHCNNAFREWLKRRYGSLENLNKEWGTCFWSQVYNSWEEVTLPSADQLTVTVSQILDHNRFASDSAIAHLNRQVDIIRKYAPHQFITHNSIGLYPWVDLFELSKKLDFISWDSYPNVDSDNHETCMSHDLQRGIKGDNFWVMEQKNGYFNYSDYNLAIEPGLVRLWAYQDIARGANGVMFYRWRSNRFNVEQNPNGLLRHDGSPRRAYYEVKQLTKELNDFGEKLVGTKVEVDAAIIFSYDQIWAFNSHKQYKSFDYIKHMFSYYKVLNRIGFTVDLVSPKTDLSKYKMVIAPALLMVDKEIAENFKKYVENGGHLVLTLRTGIKTWSNVTVDIPWPGLLADLAGVKVVEFDALPDYAHNSVIYKDKEYDVKVWLDILENQTAEVLATYGGKFYVGQPAITKNKYGSGSVVYIGVMGNDELIKDILNDLANECGLKAISVPEGVFITHRIGESSRYTFIINMNHRPQRIYIEDPGNELITGRFVMGEVLVNGMDLMIIQSK